MTSDPRLTLGTAAVLSVAEAAAWLPMEPDAAERWIRSAGIVRAMRFGGREVEVVVWGDVVEAIRSPLEEEAPLTSWKEIAGAIGVSQDTVARRRADSADQTPPYFVTTEAARNWYRSLLEPKVKPKSVVRRVRAKAPGKVQVVDWKAIARGK